MAKITFIDVNLASSIEDIIRRELKSLDSSTQEAIQSEVEAASTPKIKAAKAKDAKLDQIYCLLLDAYQSGHAVTLDTMVEIGKPEIANGISLVQQLKRFVSASKNNEYVLKRVTAGGKTAYKLIPYNAT